MSLMEDLRSQVTDKKTNELALQNEQQAQEEFYTLNLRPIMVRAKEYLDEIVSSINEIEPDIEYTYPLNPDSMENVFFSQSDHKFFYDDLQNPKKIDISCKCSLKDPAEFFVSTEASVERYAELLTNHGLTFHQKNKLDEFYNIRSASFILDETMPANISVQAHLANRCVYVYLRNFTKEPFKKYRLAPEQLTPALLEKLARILLREEAELIKVSISDPVREKLQSQIKNDQLEKEKEIASGLAYLESVRLAEEEAKLVNRAKNAVRTRISDVAAVVSSLSGLMDTKKDRSNPK